ncbi:2-amino-4-hydroxy-6-hydroxymethyldihydropteridine diphosphokinase [Pararhizobium sp. BT-229]|uniref:2-amino-4-hydroxy-6- hydroxymethyldihydropteridine diphosphokinase n=1 Tax=Pararhizobium sp. BT-229 TaxID=2986923 RepID=UPI0021F7F765|nr:2-amino-4-hydroxy-6-hydroxymethyldihydropteridine diphosphokinase [Pararhizobium sp. BT-229]MCV9960579.1 2-amino-4-hydroxy-6-hydroxymethyldihydropteridine diphosphokinase [Pararhizobium sp. BT-229]
MPEIETHPATLGLGGNIGDPAASMARALVLLDMRPDCRVTHVSRLYRTPPWGKTDQAWFFNACAQVETSLSPDELLDACLTIERQMKRERLERWGPRTIDIDVLTYGSLSQRSQTLEIPHPRMTERGFVLKPLADFAADLIVGGRTVAAWLKDADLSGIEVADARDDWWRQRAPKSPA